LAIPLYVIILAILGAGINMTRMVPEIQKTFDAASISVRPTLSLLFFRPAAETEISDPTRIRKELIETYMYFLSAPFLALAVYYLLQVIANSVSEPAMVVVSFATGLMSNTVVGSIVAFADKILKKAQS
jgi:hypothetical protein